MENRILDLEEAHELLKEGFQTYWLPALLEMWVEGKITSDIVSSVEIEKFINDKKKS